MFIYAQSLNLLDNRLLGAFERKVLRPTVVWLQTIFEVNYNKVAEPDDTRTVSLS